MTAYVALLRAINVGGTGRLPMTDLAAMCDAAGHGAVATYIASGNVVFTSDWSEARVKADLEQRLAEYGGRPVGVMVRTAAEIAAVRDGNPFPDSPGNRVLAIFLDAPPPADAADRAVNRSEHEAIALGQQQLLRNTDSKRQHSNHQRRKKISRKIKIL